MRLLTLIASLLVALPAFAQSWSSSTVERGIADYDVSFGYTFTSDGETSPLQDMQGCQSGRVQATVTNVGTGTVTVSNCTESGSCADSLRLDADTPTGGATVGRGFMRTNNRGAPNAVLSTTCFDNRNEDWFNAQQEWDERWGAGGGGGGRNVNTSVDTDGDGNDDWVIVECDYNGTNGVDAEDIHDAMQDIINETGMKYIRIQGDCVYGTDTGTVPIPAPWDPAFYNNTVGNRPLVEFTSNTIIDCDEQSTIQGWPVGVLNASGISNGQVFGNINTTETDPALKDQNIFMHNCVIDGNAPDTPFLYDHDVRQGIYLEGVDDFYAYNLKIKNTFHTGLYTRGGSRNVIYNLQCENTGSYYNNNPSTDASGQPCMYAFASDDRVTEDIWCIDCQSRRSGATAFNTRYSDLSTQSVLRGVHWRNIYAEDTGVPFSGANAAVSACANLNGVTEGTLDEAVCVRTACVDIGGQDASYTPATPSTAIRGSFKAIDCYENLAPMVIGAYTQGVAADDVTIHSTSLDPAANIAALRIDQPNRNLDLSNFKIRGGGHALGINSLNNRATDLSDARELMTLRNFSILASDDGNASDATTYDCLHIYSNVSNPVRGITFENLDITGCTRNAVRVPGGSGSLTDVVFRGGVWNGIQANWQGETTFAGLPTCTSALLDEWYTVTDAQSDCSGSGGGGQQCLCNGTTYIAYPQDNFKPAVYDGGGTFARLLFENILVENWASNDSQNRDGIYLSNLATTEDVRFVNVRGESRSNFKNGDVMESLLYLASGTNLVADVGVEEVSCGDSVGDICVGGTQDGQPCNTGQQQTDCTNGAGVCRVNCIRDLTTGGGTLAFDGESIFRQDDDPTLGGSCTTRQQWWDTDEAVGSVYAICQNQVWSPK